MKIFGIGLSKTGTSSLARALETLGYRTKDNPGIENYIPGDLSSIDRNILSEYDAFTDTPIPSFFKELDAEYPNSKFILTVRESNGWLKSCRKQFTQKLDDKQNEAHKKLFRDLYACTVFDEQLFKYGYDKFVESVIDYFKDRPHDLLVMDIIGGEGWEKLCPFLDQPIPKIAFPKANVTQIRWMNIQEIVDIARQAGEEILAVYSAKHGNKKLSPHAKSFRPALFTYIRAKFLLATHKKQQDVAKKRAYKIIFNKLRALNPAIPAVSSLDHEKSYSERRKWNHFWMVDPLENEEAFLTGEDDFTINIALIEDNKPYLGVVYAPLTGTFYYGTMGKGAFCIESGSEPRRLGKFQSLPNELSEKKSEIAYTFDNKTISSGNSTSRALMICLIADGKVKTIQTIKHTMEWQTAAAHAIAATVGLKVMESSSERDVAYNKKTLANSCITIG